MPMPAANRVGLILVLCAVVMFAARIFGPSALQRQDQPRTAAYTADIAANGRWLLPRDMFGNTATKSPLVNWLAAPLLKLGFWTEWAVKMPMLLASLTTLALTVWMAKHLLGARDVAYLAGIAWLVNPANMSMIYHCRPDPVLIAFLTATWILGTGIVCAKTEPSFSVIAGFWICIGLAGLTKGPAALVPLIYLPLAARLIGGRWSIINRSRWWWGLPLSGAIFLAWAIPCALRYPDAFYKTLIGHELIAHSLGLGAQFGNKHITSEGPIAALKLIWQNPVWFVERFVPWSLGAIAALVVIGWRKWFRHELAPTIFWLFVVLIFFSFSAHKTADYIQPAFPGAAILASWFCVTVLRRFRIQPLHFAIASLLLAIGLSLHFDFFSSLARDRRGENVKDFAREVRGIVRDDPLVFVGSGYNTLGLFLRRHQPGALPSAEEKSAAKWVVAPLFPEVAADIVSKPLPTAPISRSVTLGLYPIERVRDRIEVRTEK
ncbi:MAG: ArnT family glycosyltransferase [Chthoniobacterales bacterium]